jgi:hypothetical protein
MEKHNINLTVTPQDASIQNTKSGISPLLNAVYFTKNFRMKEFRKGHFKANQEEAETLSKMK